MGDTGGLLRATITHLAVSYQTKAKPTDTLANMEKTATSYGNPTTKSFRKQHIRLVMASGTSALVNVAILDIAAALLNAAVAARPDATFPGQIPGYQPLPKGEEPGPQHYGLALPASIAAPELAARYGYTPDGDLLVFTGDPEEYRAVAAEADTAAVLALVGQDQDPAEGAWYTGKPGTREPGRGDKGDDIQYFQLLYGCPDQDGVLNERDVALISELQRRWGLTITGTITAETWIMLVPNTRTFMIEYGDLSHTVRMLQAMLTAYDWTDGTLPITGRFDQPTGRALANVQETYGLRNHPAAGAPEWAALLGRWPLTSTPPQT